MRLLAAQFISLFAHRCLLASAVTGRVGRLVDDIYADYCR